jgi:LysM repeat protein
MAHQELIVHNGEKNETPFGTYELNICITKVISVKSLILPVLFFVSIAARAQSANAWVNTGVAYIMHTVKEGEDAARVAAYYGITLEQVTAANPKTAPVATTGNTLRVPIGGVISKSCKSQDCIKVMYKVGTSEGLYRIGINFGNQSIEDLKELNKLRSEQVSAGQELLVGYINPTKAGTAASVVPPAAVAKAEPKQAEQAQPVVVSVQPQAPVAAPEASNQTQQKPETAAAPQKPLEYKGAGFFESQYAPGGKPNSNSGPASGFKSMSGWNDGKFYALMNDVPAGTIVKISNATTGKHIFAKVLSTMPDVKKENKPLLVISEAGMVALGASAEQTVAVQVSW